MDDLQAFLDSGMCLEGGNPFCHADDFHVILGLNCIGYTLPDRPITLDPYFSCHALSHKMRVVAMHLKTIFETPKKTNIQHSDSDPIVP